MNKNTPRLERRRAHPITIFFNLWRVFYLIVIPVLRGFASALQGGLAAWLSGAWFDIVIFLFMISVAVLRWYFTTYQWDDSAIIFHSEFINFHHTVIEWRRVNTLSVVDPFYLKPFRAVYLRADTLGGSYRNSDVNLYLGREAALEMLTHYKGMADSSFDRHYKPASSAVLALAVLSSNSLAGIVFMAAFISQSGKLLGNEFSDRLIGTFEELTRYLAFGIPPAAAAIAYALITGWLIGFLLTFLRYKDFCVTLRASTLNVSGGMFTGREYSILYSGIHFIDIRQTLTTRFLKLYSLYISAVGFGKRKDDMSCVLLTENETAFLRNREAFFPSFSPSPRQVYPSGTGVMRFLFDPLLACVGIPFAMALLIYLFPNWSSFIWFVGLMSLVPAFAFLAVRIADYKTGGIGYASGKYTLRYSSGLTMHTVVIPAKQIAYVVLRQSPVQRFGPYCDLIVYTVAEGRVPHKCRSLNLNSLREFFFLESYTHII